MTQDDRQGSSPSDGEELVGETAASGKLTEKKGVQPGESASREESGAVQPRKPKSQDEDTSVHGASLLPE